MRVLVAPDKFAGTLTAPEAAAAIAEGWRRHAPHDHLDLAPMSDGGPGFVDVLHAALGGDLLAVTVRGPFAEPVPATVLLVASGAGAGADRTPTAYVESAQACGRHLTCGERGEEASSHGVGELIATAVGAGARRVVVGLGGSGSNDGGAGALAALGAVGDRPLDAGAAALAGITEVRLAVRPQAELVAATDVDTVLTGLFGATKTFGPQKGIAEDRLPAVDGLLEEFAAAVHDDGARRTALAKGAGAAGGLGFALLLLGARREPGIALVADAVGLAARASSADLVLTGEGAFDFSSRSGKVPYGVAEIAQAALRPCVALAGQVSVGAREMRALGMESAHSVVDLVGEERALADPAGSLADLAARVARSWSR